MLNFTDPILTRLAEKIVQTLEEAEKDQQLEQTDKQTDPSPTQGQGIKISLSETIESGEYNITCCQNHKNQSHPY